MKVKIFVRTGARLYSDDEKDILKAVRPMTVVHGFTTSAIRYDDDRGENPSVYQIVYEGERYIVSEQYVVDLGTWWDRLLLFFGIGD